MKLKQTSQLTSLLFGALLFVSLNACETATTNSDLENILNSTTVSVPSSRGMLLNVTDISSSETVAIFDKLKEMEYISPNSAFNNPSPIVFSKEKVLYKDTAAVRKELTQKFDTHYEKVIKAVNEFDFNTISKPIKSYGVMTISFNCGSADYSVMIEIGLYKAADIFKKDWATDQAESPVKSIKWTDATSDNKTAALTLRDGSMIKSASVSVQSSILKIKAEDGLVYNFSTQYSDSEGLTLRLRRIGKNDYTTANYIFK